MSEDHVEILGTKTAQADTYFKSLFQEISQKNPKNSKLFESYDFYYDVVLAHFGYELVAYKDRTYANGITYEDLHKRVCACESKWLAQGVQPEMTMAISMSFGLEFMLAILTALKMGMRMSILPVFGEYGSKCFLDTLTPDYIVADKHWDWTQENSTLLSVDDSGWEKEEKNTIAKQYVAADEVFLVSSMMRGFYKVQPISADQAYLSVLRDGHYCFRLTRGDQFAAPHADIMVYQPFLFLSVLMMGATYVNMEWYDLTTPMSTLRHEVFKTFVLSNEFRDGMLKNPVEIECQNWVQLVEQLPDVMAWQSFYMRYKLNNENTCRMIYDAAFSGVYMYKEFGQEIHTPYMKMVPGLSWALTETQFDMMPAPFPLNSGFLLVQYRQAEEPVNTHIYISRMNDNEMMYITLLGINKKSLIAPVSNMLSFLNAKFDQQPVYFSLFEKEVERVKNLIGVIYYNDAHYTPTMLKALIEDVKSSLNEAFSQQVAPDYFRAFPVFPKIENGKLDHSWCQEQFSSGKTQRKAKDPDFMQFSKVMWALPKVR